MATYNATNARKNFFQLLESVSNDHEVLTITGKHGNAVMLSQDDWENISETLYLSSMPGMADSIKEGMNTPLADCSPDPGW